MKLREIMMIKKGSCVFRWGHDDFENHEHSFHLILEHNRDGESFKVLMMRASTKKLVDGFKERIVYEVLPYSAFLGDYFHVNDCGAVKGDPTFQYRYPLYRDAKTKIQALMVVVNEHTDAK